MVIKGTPTKRVGRMIRIQGFRVKKALESLNPLHQLIGRKALLNCVLNGIWQAANRVKKGE